MKLRYWLAFFVALIAGVVTVVPAPASRPCLLGYYAHCSWTPLSTLICLVIAYALWWIGRRRSVKAELKDELKDPPLVLDAIRALKEA